MSFKDTDALFGTEKVGDYHKILKKRYDAGEKSVEILWRLCKCCYEIGTRAPKGQRKAIIAEGRSYGEEAVKIDDKDFNGLKWAAIMTGQYTNYLGTKEKIETGCRFKVLLDKAIAIQKDYTCYHLRGRLAYSVATLSWLEKKLAAIVFAKPPEATMDEALADFIECYSLQAQWHENLVYLGKAYLALKDKENARRFFQEAIAAEVKTENDAEYVAEAKALLAKC